MDVNGIPKTSQIHSCEAISQQEGLQKSTIPNKISISDQARILDQLSEIAEIRMEKVEEIQNKILNATYLDETKLEKAMESLLEELL